MAADNQDSKTFDPTPQRIQQFRKEGKVAVSKDIIAVAVLAIGMLGFVVMQFHVRFDTPPVTETRRRTSILQAVE